MTTLFQQSNKLPAHPMKQVRSLVLLQEGCAALEQVTHKGGRGSIPEGFHDSAR